MPVWGFWVWCFGYVWFCAMVAFFVVVCFEEGVFIWWLVLVCFVGVALCFAGDW